MTQTAGSAKNEGNKDLSKKSDAGGVKELYCGNCKGHGHLKSGCKAKVFCVVCQRASHWTEDCTILKQVKPVAKYVGYGARGLGCLLVQNTKDISAVEHANPMALVRVHSGQLNETTVSYGFSKMFEWGWTWRAKFQSPKTFLMRFPNKAKLVELKNFEKFTLLRAGAIVEVDFWSPDDKAKGKLHSVWIKMMGVPDSLRHYLGICEIGSALGPVVDVDVENIYVKEEIRLKVGVRDLHKIPAGTEITTKDLMLYDIEFEFESVAEQGWYKFDDCNKRRMFDYISIDGVNEQKENEMYKKNKSSDHGKNNVSFGSLGLKQYEGVVNGEDKKDDVGRLH